MWPREIAEANEILPRLWIGTCASCDAARGKLFCVNVLENGHTDSGECLHFRILGDDGRAKIDRVRGAGRLIDWNWTNANGLLVHCGAGVERSPLVVAMWMCQRFAMTLDEAYGWIRQRRPQAEDRRSWLIE